MHINEVCKRCGLTKKAVEYYGRQGLVRPAADENGYRNYSESDAAVLKEVAALRKLDVCIRDIRAVVFASDKAAALADCLAKAERRLRAAGAQCECLRYYRDHPRDIEAVVSLIGQRLDEGMPVREKLHQAFPGGYGVFLGLHFGRFLGGPADTAEKAAAYQAVVAFLDGLAETGFPEELERFFEEAFDPADGGALQKLDDALVEAVNDFGGYLAANRELLERHMEYRGSEAYRKSAEYRMKQALSGFFKSNGYYEVFIPNMKLLSDSYREYSGRLEKANELFLREYPQAGEPG